MKKLMIITLIVFMATIGLILDSFGQQPQYGGILRRINATGARVLGYYPEMGPQDSTEAFPAVECLMELTKERKMEPFLAESVDIDPNKKTMTFRLRKGIKFHDGSDFNAEVCAWNLQLVKDTGKIQFGDQIKSIEVVDNYTVVLHLNQYHNQMNFAYGFNRMWSKVAYETKGKEWCRTNPVGTGPFKLVEWKRDAHIKWAKFDGYWQKGKPYLDGMETYYIPDPVTASAMMQAKEADIWTGPPPVKDQVDLEKKGLKRCAYWPALPVILYFNTMDPNKPLGNLKVREAIEYAIDKAAIAKALGFGYYTPLKMVAPETEWGYDPDYKGRSYDPAKARQLLAEAGYSSGLKLKLLVSTAPPGPDQAQAVKRYLDDVGITVDVDLADMGRFSSSVWVKGWDDMVLFFTGLDLNYLATIAAWFGHEPKTNLASFKRPPELIELSKESITYLDEARQKAITKKIVRLIADEALMVPMYNNPAAYIIQPWVHTDYLQTGFIRWKLYDAWMEKH